MGFLRHLHPYRLGDSPASLAQDFPLPPPAPAYAEQCPGRGEHHSNTDCNWGKVYRSVLEQQQQKC